MADFWGPALDAELAYRHERLFTALRGIPAAEDSDSRTQSGADESPVTAGPDDSLRPVTPTHPLVSAARGWLLRGSETWHAAR